MIKKWRQWRDARKTKRIEKAGKLVKNAKAIRDDRWAALEYLKAVDDKDRAVPALLERFEYSLEHGINDTREKELAMEGIVKYGPSVLEIVENHLKKTTRIAWPIKILKAVADDQKVSSSLLSVLDFKDVAFNQSAVDKNYDILCYLRDYAVPQEVKKLAHFLQDPDERVRFACVELLLEQNVPEVADLSEVFLYDQTAENRRIKQAVLQAFVDRGWKVSAGERQIAYGVTVQKDGTLKAAKNTHV